MSLILYNQTYTMQLPMGVPKKVTASNNFEQKVQSMRIQTGCWKQVIAESRSLLGQVLLYFLHAFNVL
jgi:hypothetical protein